MQCTGKSSQSSSIHVYYCNEQSLKAVYQHNFSNLSVHSLVFNIFTTSNVLATRKA